MRVRPSERFRHHALWPEEDELALRKCVAQGMSDEQVVKHFGGRYTRYAVCKKRARMGLRSTFKTQESKILTNKILHGTFGAKLGYDTEQFDFQKKPAQVIPLVKLKAGQCRYPYGNPKDEDFGFCGKPAFEKSALCEEHHERCRLPYKGRTA